MTLPGFIGHLAGAAAALHHHEHRAMERACKMVQREAKREIGKYQGAIGPFMAWQPLAESTLEEKFKLGYTGQKSADDPLLRTGIMRDSIGIAVGEREGVVGSNDDIAEYQELGTARIPPRSFLGGAAARKGPQLARILGLSPVVALVGEEVAGRALRIPLDEGPE
jgi:hypothetical protein